MILTTSATLAAAAATPGYGQSANRARDVVRLYCDAAQADTPARAVQMLCQQVIQVLARAAPSHTIRRVPTADAAPRVADELFVGVTLVSMNTLALEWQKGPTGRRHTGPQYRLNTPVPQASARDLQQAVQVLLEDTPPLAAALRGE